MKKLRVFDVEKIRKYKMNRKTNNEKMIILGFMVFLLYKYDKGIGSKTIDLCMCILKNSNQTYGKDYEAIHENMSNYSIATIHKVFSLFVKRGIIKKDKGGNFYFDGDYALELANKEDIFL